MASTSYAPSSFTTAVRVCFTWFNYPPSFKDELYNFYVTRNLKFLVFQEELAPNTGRPHVQGYFEAPRAMRRTTICNSFSTAVHLEKARGSATECAEYCKKVDTRKPGTVPVIHGAIAESRAGFRSDLETACQLAKEYGTKRVAEELPAVYVRNFRGLQAYEEAVREERRDDDFVPRVWQAKLLATLKGDADDRTIHWVHDSVGTQGKSRLVRHLCLEHGGVLLSGKLNDMSHLWTKGEYRIACFDISRTQQDHMEHLISFAEQLKNGTICSGKYDGRVMYFDTPHVVFMSNSMPKDNYWSEDRLQLLDLDKPEEHVPTVLQQLRVDVDPLRFC